MLQQKTQVNGKNIFTEYGILLVKGAYEAMRTRGEYKELVSNTANTEHGQRQQQMPAQMRYYKSRELSFSIVASAASQDALYTLFDNFIDAISQAPTPWQVPALGLEFFFTLTKHSDIKPYKNGAVITATMKLTLTEPNPNNRNAI